MIADQLLQGEGVAVEYIMPNSRLSRSKSIHQESLIDAESVSKVSSLRTIVFLIVDVSSGSGVVALARAFWGISDQNSLSYTCAPK